MTSITLFGGGGRMGRAIADYVSDRDDLCLVDDEADVYIDFSAPDGLKRHLEIAAERARPVVVGTTALTTEHHRLLDAAAGAIPVLQAANMALGVHMLAHMVRDAAARLGPEWDIEIVELHHRAKIDAPSGTALMLGQIAAEGRGVEFDKVSARARDGDVGPRRRGDIGFAVLRGGTAAGEHQVLFAGERERIELCHRAESREVFARGAVRAALWLTGKPPGRYSMEDVLGLS